MTAEGNRQTEIPFSVAELRELIATGLTPAGLPETDTEKFDIEGHPDLLVRLNRGYPIDGIVDAKCATDALLRYGINVLPSTPVEFEGEVYVVTKRVTGIGLDVALQQNPAEQLVKNVHQIWGGLAKRFVDGKREGGLAVCDINGAGQWMVGTVAGATHQTVSLVDLPVYAFRLADSEDYAVELLELTNGVRELEALTGNRLIIARAAIEQALRASDDPKYYGDGIANATRFVLEHGVELHVLDDEERIQELRTR